MCGTDCFLALLSILFPPIGVWVKRGLCSADSLINLALCCLGYLPGLLHAWYIIFAYPDDPFADDYNCTHGDHRRRGSSAASDPEGTRHVTYYYVQQPAPRRLSAQPSYGTMPPQNAEARSPRAAPVATAPPAGARADAVPDPYPGQAAGAANAFAGRVQTAGAGEQAQGQGQGQEGAGPSDGAPPPSYADAVKGDFKVQSQD
ncbi:hypothetical protein BDY21DRAFT_362427 [Lineolata rhizophorae]|uniref:Stress response RCI peptide n=1 Tax=Lineolata rhizophorae TaxID=578093 RepID=A0A6A6P529_9PEZI|nr:hypothetical protein BDY21DRAFT_362427 [Lineolata rhizophorae]